MDASPTLAQRWTRATIWPVLLSHWGVWCCFKTPFSNTLMGLSKLEKFTRRVDWSFTGSPIAPTAEFDVHWAQQVPTASIGSENCAFLWGDAVLKVRNCWCRRWKCMDTPPESKWTTIRVISIANAIKSREKIERETIVYLQSTLVLLYVPNCQLCRWGEKAREKAEGKK